MKRLNLYKMKYEVKRVKNQDLIFYLKRSIGYSQIIKILKEKKMSLNYQLP
jgi:hypothetical protein